MRSLNLLAWGPSADASAALLLSAALAVSALLALFTAYELVSLLEGLPTMPTTQLPRLLQSLSALLAMTHMASWVELKALLPVRFGTLLPFALRAVGVGMVAMSLLPLLGTAVDNADAANRASEPVTRVSLAQLATLCVGVVLVFDLWRMPRVLLPMVHSLQPVLLNAVALYLSVRWSWSLSWSYDTSGVLVYLFCWLPLSAGLALLSAYVIFPNLCTALKKEVSGSSHGRRNADRHAVSSTAHAHHSCFFLSFLSSP